MISQKKTEIFQPRLMKQKSTWFNPRHEMLNPIIVVTNLMFNFFFGD